MNRTILVSIMAAGLLAGCASMRDADTPPAAVNDHPGRIEPDKAYMARVEQRARMRGIQVTWINPPVKRPTGEPR